MRNDIKLAAAAFDERFCLAQNLIHRPRSKLAANRRDCTICAFVAASLGNLQVGKGLAGKPKLRHLRLNPFGRNALPNIHAWEFRLGLWIALWIAARHDNLAEIATRLQLKSAKDFAFRFFARGLNERTSVDNHHIRSIRIGRKNAPVLEKIACHHLKVHSIFGAPQRNERKRCFCLSHSRSAVDDYSSSARAFQTVSAQIIERIAAPIQKSAIQSNVKLRPKTLTVTS